MSISVDNDCTPLLCCAVYVDRVVERDEYGGVEHVEVTGNSQRKARVVIIGQFRLLMVYIYL